MAKTIASLIAGQSLVAVSPETSIQETVETMAKAKIGTILVVKNGSLKGVFSERDLIGRALIQKLPLTSPVSKVMTAKVKAIRGRHDTQYCLEQMKQYKCRSMPVIEWWNTALGIVSIIDVLIDMTTELENEKKSFESMAKSQPIFESYTGAVSLKAFAASQSLMSLTPNSMVSEAISIMGTKKVGCVLILEGAQLRGIFSERDVIGRVLGKKLDPEKVALKDVMTSPVESIESSAVSEQCLQVMRRLKCRHLPITENGAVIGVVSIINCLQWMFDEFKFYNDQWQRFANIASAGTGM